MVVAGSRFVHAKMAAVMRFFDPKDSTSAGSIRLASESRPKLCVADVRISGGVSNATTAAIPKATSAEAGLAPQLQDRRTAMGFGRDELRPRGGLKRRRRSSGEGFVGFQAPRVF